VSRVAFDSYSSSPNSDGSGKNIVYIDLVRLVRMIREAQHPLVPLLAPPLVVPMHRAHAYTPSMREVPTLSPLAVHRVHTVPLSGLIFNSLKNISVLTVCREGHIKIWIRPTSSNEGPLTPYTSDSLSGTSMKEKPLFSGENGNRQ
ncbi:hypothetical protein Tco_0964035, partial [Tanacetum coccineum]